MLRAFAPELVGNRRHIVVSDQAGRPTCWRDSVRSGSRSTRLIPRSRNSSTRSNCANINGYAYDGADASFELLARRALEGTGFFRLHGFRVSTNGGGMSAATVLALSEAVIKAEVKGRDRDDRGGRQRPGQRPRSGLRKG